MKINELDENEGIKGDLILFCKKIIEGSEGKIEGTNYKKIRVLVDDGETELELSVSENAKNYGKNSNVEKIKNSIGKRFKLCNGYYGNKNGVKYLSTGFYAWIKPIENE